MSQVHTPGLLSWYHREFSEIYYPSVGGAKLRYGLYSRDSSRGLLIIVPGRTEFIEKYLEVAWDLRQSGYNICIYDHCGQGKSDRMLEERDKGHIPDFAVYVEDLFHLSSSLGTSHRPTLLLSHSMGGTIATRFCQDYPGHVNGLILVSPMFQINTGPRKPPVLVESLCRVADSLGFSKMYAWGTGPFRAELPFDSNPLTSDQVRFERNFEYIDLEPALALGGPTWGWLRQAYRAMRSARQKSSHLVCPVLLLRGLADKVVGMTEMEQFCQHGEDRELTSIPDARHELLMEQDRMRGAALEKINTFLRQFSH
jgi:lysophospholipase